MINSDIAMGWIKNDIAELKVKILSNSSLKFLKRFTQIRMHMPMQTQDQFKTQRKTWF